MIPTIDDVISKYRSTYYSVDALVFEPTVVEKIVVSFTGMQIGHYNRWSWFCNRYQQDKTLYIIFKDDDRMFYLDRESGPVCEHHADFVKQKLKKHGLTSKNLYTLGMSMGGYSAIYFAFKLDAYAAITSSPLVDSNSATPRLNPSTNLLEPSTDLWTRQMSALGDNWIDLDRYIQLSDSDPKVFVAHGTYGPDLMAVNKLVTALKSKHVSYIVNTVDKAEHSDYLPANILFDLLKKWPE